MDRRIIKTRRIIFKAMNTLMLTMPYDKIQVKDIIEFAEIGRSTFYAHFETKEDLAQAICFELFDHVFKSHVENCKVHSGSNKDYTMQEKFSHFFSHFQNKQDYYKPFLTYEEGRLLTRFFKAYIEQNVTVKFTKPGMVATQRDYMLNYIFFALVGTLEWWLKNRMQVSPEKLAEYFMAATNSIEIEFQLKNDAE